MLEASPTRLLMLPGPDGQLAAVNVDTPLLAGPSLVHLL